MSDDRSWPELGEELGRKALEHLESRLLAYNRGKITRRELYLVADALCDAMQGLAPKNTWQAVYDTRQALRKGDL